MTFCCTGNSCRYHPPRKSLARLELPLETELDLPGVQGLDQTPVCVEPVILAHAESVGVVGEVVEADAEQEDAVIFPPLEALGYAQIDIEDARAGRRDSGRVRRDAP